MRPGGGKLKGGAYERDICKRLSLWYTENQRDDVFFRSASSGAMATQRFKKGKKTSGQQGDITSTDIEGIRFINKFSIELKSYKDFSLDFLVYKNKSLIHDWWEQCKGDAERDDKSPLLIIKKNKKKEIIPVEAKYQEKISAKDIKGTLAFMESHNLKKGIIITKVFKEHDEIILP